MATKIKVKKITDLTRLPADAQSDIYGNIIPGAQDEDQIIVAHKTNINDEDGAQTAVVHTNSMELGELLKYVSDGLKGKYMSEEDGEELKELIEEKLREAEENMAKGNDTYSSNYFVDDAGTCTFNATEQNENGGYWRYTSEYTFKSTGAANCHLTIYRGKSGAITANSKAPTISMYAKILIKTRTGDWKTICQQPVQSADGAFDIELHGYFYAGTVIKGAVFSGQSITVDNSGILFNSAFSCLQVTRFSSDKGFPNKSFDWWVSNNGTQQSAKTPPGIISSNGFLKFDGLYYHSLVGVVGQKAGHYYDSKKTKWTRHYCTDAVYAKVKYPGKDDYVLGNTEANAVAKKQAGVKDDFSGKYYYLSANSDNVANKISVYTQTDFTFTDDTKAKGGGYADSGGGWHNATLIQYIDYDELSTTLDGLPDDISVHCLSDIQEFFKDDSAHMNNYHTFIYSGGLAPSLTANVNKDATAATYSAYMGTSSRNMARLHLKSYDGTTGCYVREDMGSLNASLKQTNYSFIPSYSGGQWIHTIIRDPYNARWTDNDHVSSRYTPIEYKFKLLNENIESIQATNNPYSNTKIVKGQAKTDSVTVKEIASHLTNWINSGWSLISVNLLPAPDGQDITIPDFGFASCPRLSSFTFPKNVNFTGRYTFAAPSTKLNWLSCGPMGAAIGQAAMVIPKSQVVASRLSSVSFYNDNAGGCTHIDGINGNGQMWATFANCVSLISTDIEHTDVKILGDHTFLSCGKLRKIDMPSCVTSLGNSVFTGCKSLSSISIPATVTKFGTKVFTGCQPLVSANKFVKNQGFTHQLGIDYDITIKLSGEESNYYDTATATLNKSKIWSEISGLVKCLQAENMGQTTANKTYTSRAGRRFYIAASNSVDKKIGGTQYVFNTILTNNKVGVFTEANIEPFTVPDREYQC